MLPKPKLPVKFFRTSEGKEPVRQWLKDLPGEERKAIGDDIRTVQFVLLHGFIKKSPKTPDSDLETAKQRRKLLKPAKE